MQAFEKYADHIVYVHFKDVDPDVNVSPEWPMNRFLPLGLGTIDWKTLPDLL